MKLSHHTTFSDPTYVAVNDRGNWRLFLKKSTAASYIGGFSMKCIQKKLQLFRYRKSTKMKLRSLRELLPLKQNISYIKDNPINKKNPLQKLDTKDLNLPKGSKFRGYLVLIFGLLRDIFGRDLITVHSNSYSSPSIK
ncbi:hypothetical protein Anas_09452 [Armadillidium nasatum]|uniref:Uncharacterized protein n=1 Tax=Armadillidium nasatum TaxID=96803 RepID=A0A5N5TD93_9CRUS|nr:hypothetical protein Anas_09452 [Armadillidium nasatum]